MKVILKNNTDLLQNISDIGLVIYPNDEKSIDTDIIQVKLSKQLIKLISDGIITVNNFIRDLLPSEGVKFIITNELMPLDIDGKLFVHQTSRNPGTTTYWTGRGDKADNVSDVGNGEYLTLSNFPGEPSKTVKYMDINSINNDTNLHEGYFIWENAKYGDYISLSVVTNTVEFIPSAGTNFYNYYDVVIIPSNGQGNVQVTTDLTNPCISGGSFVQVYTDETGYRPPAYWNAVYNDTTKLYENITPAPSGDGEFNLYPNEIIGNRFVNNIPLIGSGFERLQASDSTIFPHGMRLKLEMHTTNDDHEWHVSGIITMHRERTV